VSGTPEGQDQREDAEAAEAPPPVFEAASWFEPSEPEGLRRRIDLDAADSPNPAEDPWADGAEERPLAYPAIHPVPDPGGSVLDPNEAVTLPEEETADGDPRWVFETSESVADTQTLDPADPPEVVQVRRLAGAIAKAVKATRIYPIDNPICRKFADALAGSFRETFELVGEVRLAVGKTKFFFRGDAVLDQPGREESVPGRFFWDGIREITFRNGLTPAEITAFLSMCRVNHETAEQGEDDLVTLFWQNQFEHVAIIAVDDILDLENPDDPVPEEFGTHYMNFVDLDMHNLEDDDEDFQVEASAMAKEIQARMREAEENLYGVPQADRDALLAELAEDESPKVLADIFTIIAETLYLDHHETSFVETVDVLAGALTGLVEEGRIIVAAGLVRLLAALRLERRDLTDAMVKALDEGLSRGWGESSCNALLGHLNGNHPEVLAGLDGFFALLPPQASVPLCEMLVDLENERARRKLVAALTRLARTQVDVFLPYLNHPKPAVVHDIIRILGGTGSDKAVRPLKALMRHPNVEVRSLALESLCRLGPAKSGDAILGALYDEDSRVRIAAARGLGESGRMAIPTLIQIIEDDDFKHRDFQEKKTVFRALGTAGGENLTGFMESYLNRRSFFRRAAVEELRACACEALGWIGGPKATRLLERVADDRSAMVRGAAQAALRRINGFEREDRERSAA